MKRALFSLVSVIALAACQGGEKPVEASKTEAAVVVADIASIEAVYADGAYDLSWTFDGEAMPVTVEVTTNPDAEVGELIGEGISELNFKWTPEHGLDARHYFIIRPEHGDAEMVATRLLPLEGGRNFRTLGGYETEDGKTVKWGKIYRSGVMDGLTENDYEYLSSIGIKVVCDYRTEMERTEEPTDWEAGEIDYLYFPDPTDDMGASFGAIFRDPELTPQKVKDAFGASYFGMAHQQAPAYAEMFDRLAAGEAPLVFNCSAGKDRTGVSAALILTVLGVPRETIVHDYQLSDDYVDYMSEFLNEEARQKAIEEGSPYAFLFQLPPETVAPMMASYPEYIETFFAAIEAEYGSVEVFLKEKVDLTDEEIAAIRANYLE